MSPGAVEGGTASSASSGSPPSAEEGPRRSVVAFLHWLRGDVAGRPGHSGALVPAGWALYNGMWMAVEGGFDASARTGVGSTWPLYLYGGAIAIVFVFAALVTMSRWRHPLEPRTHPFAPRGDAALYGALGAFFGGIAVVWGMWWMPLCGVSLALATWMAVKDLRDVRRVPG